MVENHLHTTANPETSQSRQLLSKEQNPEECDATGDAISNAAGYIIILIS
jgi:hypothetical protein